MAEPLDPFIADAVKNGLLDDSSSVYSSSSSSSSSSPSSSSSSDTDEGYQFHARRLLKDLPKMRRSLFKRLFGMSRETFRALYNDIWEELPIGQSSNGKSLCPEERLAYCLYSMRSNGFNVFTAWANDIGEGTMSRNTSLLIDILNPRDGSDGAPCFVKRHIYLPSTEKSLQDRQNFSVYGFPPLVMMLVDGMHILVSNLKKPP